MKASSKKHSVNQQMVKNRAGSYKSSNRKSQISNRKSNDLPEGWVWTKLGHICRFEYGRGLPKNKRRGGKYPVYGSNGIIGYHNDYLVKGRTIIIGRKGSSGKINISDKSCWAIDTTYYIPEASIHINFDFLILLLKNLQLDELDRSTAVPGLNREEAYQINIPIPPIPEQGRIVKKVNNLYARLNKTKQELAKIPLLLKKFRQSVLAKAFSGELTKEWREKQSDLEPASKLLERIRQERKKLLGKKYKEPQPIDASNLPELPEGWEYTRIKDIGKVVTGSTPKTQVSKYWDGDIVWLTPKDLGKNSSKYIADSQRKITKKGYESCSTKLVPKDSIVISTRAPIGHIAIVKVDFCTNQGCKSLLPHKGIFSDYLYYLLVHNKEILQGLGSGTTFSELSKDKLEDFVIPLPSFVEQKYIVKMIEDFFAQAETIEKSVKMAQAHCEKLNQSILAKAFRGELVEQDPNDEPAEELLKRIEKKKLYENIRGSKSD